MASATAVASNGASINNGNSNGNSNGSANTATPDSIQEQIRQLDDARKLVLANVGHYPMIVQGILPILNPSSLPALRRWGADFLAEAFAAPSMPSREKESLSLLVLESLKGMLENNSEDPIVLRSIIQAAASIYPLVLRWLVHNAYDTATWERLCVVKTRILRLWEAPLPSVQICCVKFAQRVVLAQTMAAAGEQHRRDGLDASLKMIPPNHALLDPRHLEAEATGLLDRMLSVLQEQQGQGNDAIIVDATLNTLSILVRTRPSTANRIVQAILAFDPLRAATAAAAAAGGPIPARTRVMVKSMEKTTRMLLVHLTKRDDPHSALHKRMVQQIERLMMRSKAELVEDGALRKRPGEVVAGTDAKRQRTQTPQQQQQQQQQHQQMTLPQRPLFVDIPPLGPPPHSLADVFALTTSAQLRSFSAAAVPLELVAKISVATLARLDAAFLQRAIAGVRDRLTALDAAAATSGMDANTVPLDAEPGGGGGGGGDEEDDDDDYEPDFSAAEDAEQILNKLDGEGTSVAAENKAITATTRTDSSLALGAFQLPMAPALSTEQAVQVGQATVLRVFGMMQEEETASTAVAPTTTTTTTTTTATRRQGKAGLNRVAATTFDRDAWLTIVTRLATRSVSGLGDVVKPEGDSVSLNDKIRELLFRYVLEDFRKRIDTAVAWLCEEWYACALDKKTAEKSTYNIWSLKVLDGFVPYLHTQDKKVLTRFLSGIPALNADLMQRVKSLCRDPSMVLVALTALLYQVKMRPPARALTLDTMEAIYEEFEDARTVTAKYLGAYRPEFVAAAAAREKEKEAAEKEVAEKRTAAAEEDQKEASPDVMDTGPAEATPA